MPMVKLNVLKKGKGDAMVRMKEISKTPDGKLFIDRTA